MTRGWAGVQPATTTVHHVQQPQAYTTYPADTSPQTVTVAAPQATHPRLKAEEDVRVEEVRGGEGGGAGRRRRRARVVRVR